MVRSDKVLRCHKILDLFLQTSFLLHLQTEIHYFVLIFIYGAVVWASTSTTKLKKLTSKQKQALRILNNEFTDIREIMVRMKVLNIYKLNIYQILNFMFKIKANTAPCIFENQFTEIHHQYLTRFSKNSFVKSQLIYSQTKFCALSRGPRLWNKLLDQQQKSVDRETSFKKSIKRTKIFLNFLK